MNFNPLIMKMHTELKWYGDMFCGGVNFIYVFNTIDIHF